MVHILLAVIYLAFISLGLPDSLLGAAWPSMYGEFGVPVSYAGVISMIIAVGTVISSLNSDRMTKKFGAGVVTAFSTALSAAALFGFSVSHSFAALCILAVPYGLGAGGIDAALNNYVALHYASRHMSWLHCMWGVGTIVGPYVMEYALTSARGWNFGYSCISIAQVVLTVILIISLPLWKKRVDDGDSEEDELAKKPLSLKEIFAIRGAKEVMVAFFCYCAIEQTTILWASSYMVLHNGVLPEIAAGYAGLFFIGITVGRAVSGFLTFKFSDTQMIRIGQVLIAVGIVCLFLPLGYITTIVGLILIGLGCAPIYPCIIHSTPEHFGAQNSQAVIGVQMASAYIGVCVMPPLFGLIANHISVALLPVYLLIILLLMIFMHERLVKITK